MTGANLGVYINPDARLLARNQAKASSEMIGCRIPVALVVSLAATVALAADTRHHGGVAGGIVAGIGIGQGGGLLGLGVVGGGGGHGVSGGGYQSPPAKSCRYWCKTPQNQAYCCEDGNDQITKPFVKPGSCPPVRPQCPPVRSGFRPPNQCSNDSRCPGYEKCCYDTCLEHHTCKAPGSSW